MKKTNKVLKCSFFEPLYMITELCGQKKVQKVYCEAIGIFNDYCIYKFTDDFLETRSLDESEFDKIVFATETEALENMSNLMNTK